MTGKPAVSLAAVPGQRKATLEIARRIEREGFAGIYCPSFGDALGLCEALALATHEIPFGTAIASIYPRHVSEYAQTAALVHELSNGRFRFGIGVSHGFMHERSGITPGPPLADVRRFVEDFRACEPVAGPLPPVVLAALRTRMVALAGEIAQGAIWANAARSHMPRSLRALPAEVRQDPEFFLSAMVPTCVADDRAETAAVLRRVLGGYVRLPNYQRYWIEAGYEEEMRAIQRAIAARDFARLPELMTDRWLDDVTLHGDARRVRNGIEAWRDAGVTTVILVPSSTTGSPWAAYEEVFSAFGAFSP